MKYKLKKSSTRFIYIGSEEAFEFDEIEVLAKVTPQKIFYTSDIKTIGINKTSVEIPMQSFIRYNIKSGKIIKYCGQRWEAHLMKRFMLTSGLNFPEIYDQKLVSEYLNEGNFC